MKVLFSPQVREDKIEYKFTEDMVIVTYKGESEEYNFSGMPNGVADYIETEVFDFRPVLSAKKENGILHLELINFIGKDATAEERFSEWFEVKFDGEN